MYPLEYRKVYTTIIPEFRTYLIFIFFSKVQSLTWLFRIKIPFKTKFAHIHTNSNDSESSKSVNKMDLTVKIEVELRSNQRKLDTV